MGAIPPDMSLEEYDRQVIAEWKARRASGVVSPSYSSDRVHELLLELERRCTAAGKADPAIAEELLGKLRRGEPF